MYSVDNTIIDYDAVWRMIWLVCKGKDLSLGINIYNKLKRWNLRDAVYEDNCSFFRDVLDFISKYYEKINNDVRLIYLYRVFGIKMYEFGDFIENTKIKSSSFCKCGEMDFEDWDYRCRYPVYEIIHEVDDILSDIKKWQLYFNNKPNSLVKTKTFRMMSDVITNDCAMHVLDYLW